jgi:predicted aminopeptidase
MKIGLSLLYAVLPVLAAAIILLLGSTLFSGCYTLTQGAAMLGYLNRAVPLESLAEDTEAGEADMPTEAEGSAKTEAKASAPQDPPAAFVRRVTDIRRFAIEDLGLRESKNYTRYVEIDRDYLAAVVSASARDSFTRYEWWFPVVGKVPYKGFFKVQDARRQAEKLEKKDLDVWVRGVDAFSTLGWFADPLYSYMRKYTPYRLADLIIHELLHATVYLNGRSQFNEELAEFVGSEGARLYIAKTYGPDSGEYQQIGESEKESAAFLAFIRGLIGELETLYESNAEKDEKLKVKGEIIREAQARFEAEYDTLFQSDNYRGFPKLQVNNAYLELYRLYYEEDSFFKDLYDRSDRDLRLFIAAAKTLKTRAGDPKARLAEALGLTAIR